MSWTKEQEDLILQRWAQGWSAGQIELELKGRFSRSAVLGKLRRLGAPMRDKSTGNRPAARKPPKPKPPVDFRSAKAKANAKANKAPALVREPIPVAKENDVARVSLAALGPDTCRWPVGDPGEPGFGFCGLKPSVGSSYCAHHRARASGGFTDPSNGELVAKRRRKAARQRKAA